MKRSQRHTGERRQPLNSVESFTPPGRGAPRGGGNECGRQVVFKQEGPESEERRVDMGGHPLSD